MRMRMPVLSAKAFIADQNTSQRFVAVATKGKFYGAARVC